MDHPQYCQIAFPIEQDGLYTYRVPEKLQESLKPGMRVIAPFGRRRQSGYCSALSASLPEGLENVKIRNIESVVDTEPLFPDALMDLLRWISNYYLCPPGQVYKTAHPAESGLKRVPVYMMNEETATHPGLRKLPEDPRGMEVGRENTWTDEERKDLEHLIRDGILSIENTWPAKMQQSRSRYLVLDRSPDEKLNPVQLRVVRYLETLPDKTAQPAAIRQHLGCSDSPLKTLLKNGILSEHFVENEADPFNDGFPVRHRTVQPDPDQQAIIDEITSNADTFHPVLLHGVTGSGKTEIYIQLARKMLEAGKDVLILVPEISLTPQIAGRFRAVFEDKVAIWHSQMTAVQRLWTWSSIRKGRIRVVVGARSALFSPFRNPGLLIVDEEHEGSYKQESPAPRYHARDAALYYGRILQVPVILGSATPSFESWYLSQQGKLKYYSLKRRFGKALPPSIGIVDMTRAHHDGILSRQLLDEIRRTLARNEQIILLQNRRGFNTVQQCTQCGKTVQCDHCSVNYTYHKSVHLLRCHYCGETREPLQRCPHCGDTLRLKGTGTQKIEEHLQRVLPSTAIVRMDHDTTQNKNAHIRILDAFEKGEYQILLGTQMIAKGLDFHNVTLVGIINADIGAFLPDFRSGEQLFQLISQVSGRAGRGEKSGRVLIQTYNPELPALDLVVKNRQSSFYHQELDLRKELNYPPYSRVALLRFIGRDAERVADAARACRTLLAGEAGRIALIGPAPASVEKVQGLTRWQILLKSSRERDPSAARLHDLLVKARNMPLPAGVRLQVNMDPMSMS